MLSPKNIAIRFALFIAASVVIGAAVLWASQPDIEQVDIKHLNTSSAITQVVGSGAHQVHIFESTDCTFCRQLQPELDKLRDVTLHVHVLPGHTQMSKAHASAVYCDSAPYQAWHDLMKNQVMPEQANCTDTSAEKNLSVAKQLGLVRTPTLIRADGKVLLGLKSAEEIQRWLDQKQKN